MSPFSVGLKERELAGQSTDFWMGEIQHDAVGCPSPESYCFALR
jgi:hypothetical protein